jgi:hypothetical protein
MQKRTIIKNIKSIIEKYGTFSIGEVDNADGVLINQMGHIIGIAEYFNGTTIEVSIYDSNSFSSDAIDSYEENYNDLPKATLQEILSVAELFEVDQEKTLKRCAD